MSVTVTIRLQDGTEEYFDTFVNEHWANYNISLAKCSPDSMYNTEKYDNAEWILTKGE